MMDEDEISDWPADLARVSIYISYLLRTMGKIVLKRCDGPLIRYPYNANQVFNRPSIQTNMITIILSLLQYPVLSQ